MGKGKGSRLYELNLWMWSYGRRQPCKVTVEEAEQRRRELLIKASNLKRAVQTLKLHEKSAALRGLLGTRMLWEMNEEEM